MPKSRGPEDAVNEDAITDFNTLSLSGKATVKDLKDFLDTLPDDIVISAGLKKDDYYLKPKLTFVVIVHTDTREPILLRAYSDYWTNMG